MIEETVEDVVAALRDGRVALVLDADDRENEGDLVLAAEHATAERVAFMVVHGRGLLCLTLTAERAAELGLTPMARTNSDPFGTAFTVSIDATARHGVGTGISASDRATTARLAVTGRPEDFTQPGHLFPLVARPGGVLERPGHTEAAVDLMRLAGLAPAALIVEVIGDDGEMLRGDALRAYGARHGLPVTTIEDLRHYLRASPGVPA